MNQIEKAVADLRHAYHQLTEGVVKDQAKFADGLIAPAIYRIEQALGQGEPVARVSGYYAGRCVIEPLNRAMVMPEGMSLYAAPQPQREWVGLTDEKVRDLWSWSASAEAERIANTQQHAFARAIETKLKEKNHGLR